MNKPISRQFFFNFIWLALAAYSTFLIFAEIDLFSVDHLGQIASAKSFFQSGFHHFDDSLGLGYIHNLFYPPLQDLLLALFNWPFKFEPQASLLIYKLYLTTISLSVMFLFYQFSKDENNFFRRSLISLLFFIFFFASKENPSISWYGGTFYDLFKFGLSAQFLSLAFLFAYIYESEHKNRLILNILFISLCFLSHLITPFVLIAYLFISLLEHRSLAPRKIFELLFSIGLTAFFWGPFFLYKNYSLAAHVANLHSIMPLLFLLIFSLIIFLKKNSFKFIVTSFSLIFGVTLFSLFFQQAALTPVKFSFHRLIVYALYFFILSTPSILKSANSKKQTFFLTVLILSFALLFVRNFVAPSKNEVSHEDFNFHFPKHPHLERSLTINHLHPLNFGPEMYGFLNREIDHSIKGFYWEYHPSQILLSTYLVSIEGGKSMLEVSPFPQASEPESDIFLKSFFRNYAIGLIVLPAHTKKMNPISHFLSQHQISALNTQMFRTVPYRSYRLESTQLHFGMAEVLSATTSFYYHEHADAHSYLAKTIQNYQERNQHTLFLKNKSDLSLLESSLATPPQTPEITFQKTQEQIYSVKFKTPFKHAIPIWIKLNYFPGLQAFDTAGTRLPLIELHQGVIILSRQSFSLHYAAPPYSKILLFLSTFFLFILIIWFLIRNIWPFNRLH